MEKDNNISNIPTKSFSIPKISVKNLQGLTQIASTAAISNNTSIPRKIIIKRILSSFPYKLGDGKHSSDSSTLNKSKDTLSVSFSHGNVYVKSQENKNHQTIARCSDEFPSSSTGLPEKVMTNYIKQEYDDRPSNLKAKEFEIGKNLIDLSGNVIANKFQISQLPQSSKLTADKFLQPHSVKYVCYNKPKFEPKPKFVLKSINSSSLSNKNDNLPGENLTMGIQAKVPVPRTRNMNIKTYNRNISKIAENCPTEETGIKMRKGWYS